jgi:hypothetical protein
MVYMRPIPSGTRFGRLTVTGRAPSRRGRAFWFVRCECGSSGETSGTMLRDGTVQSCGCHRSDRMALLNLTHGNAREDAETAEYRAWHGMRQRCHDPRNAGYRNYGGRGIRVCTRWRESFAAFLEDVGPRPGPEYSLDRVNNDGHYEPGNVRWATHIEQCRNTRNNVLLTFRGETKCLAAWAEALGVAPITLRSRIDRGWTVERALTTPVDARFSRGGPRHSRGHLRVAS